jgi:hypothetical protein
MAVLFETYIVAILDPERIVADCLSGPMYVIEPGDGIDFTVVSIHGPLAPQSASM